MNRIDYNLDLTKISIGSTSKMYKCNKTLPKNPMNYSIILITISNNIFYVSLHVLLGCLINIVMMHSACSWQYLNNYSRETTYKGEKVSKNKWKLWLIPKTPVNMMNMSKEKIGVREMSIHNLMGGESIYITAQNLVETMRV